MKIELRPLAEIKPYEKNPRINDAAVEAVARSIREFGFRQPVVVDAHGVIVCGHTRLKAAAKLGLERVPVHVARELTPEQARAYRIADNKTGDLATWDLELLPTELAELQGLDVDLSLLGFGEDELAELLDPGVKQGLTDPDAVPDPPGEAVTQRGDVWVLGDHRLLCGDSSSATDVDRLLDGAPVHLVNTDPPYNVKVEPRSNNAIAAGVTSFSRREDLQCERSTSERGKRDRERIAKRTHHQAFDVVRQGEKKATHRKMRAKDRPLTNDFVSDEEFDRMLHTWFGNIARVLLPGRTFYIWGGYANIGNYPPVLKACELYFSQAIIWDKQHPVLTRKDYMGAHEWCFYGWREGAAHAFLGPNNVPDLWHVKKINPQQMEHLTAKPAELAVRAMQYSSRVGENVLDLFGGSGSTLIAAEQTGRRAFLMELDPLYCDVIADRFQRFSGKPAVLERTGTSPIPMKPREENMR
ncbi:MAG: ParB N-terminal domain-containing protein [Phycisphaerales bacterium]|nr:MAG: ParB N-terminal domain-containing protein [Phycisphaerales bacterium]